MAIDISRAPVVPLAEYIAERGRTENMRPHYGVDQADSSAVESIMNAEFQSPLDLVIDNTMAAVRKGGRRLSIPLDIDGLYMNRGRKLVHI